MHDIDSISQWIVRHLHRYRCQRFRLRFPSYNGTNASQIFSISIVSLSLYFIAYSVSPSRKVRTPLTGMKSVPAFAVSSTCTISNTSDNFKIFVDLALLYFTPVHPITHRLVVYCYSTRWIRRPSIAYHTHFHISYVLETHVVTRIESESILFHLLLHSRSHWIDTKSFFFTSASANFFA